MDVLIQLIGAVAWPLAALAIVLILRKDLGNLLGRVSKVRYKELEAEFRETLKEIAGTTEEASLETPEPGELDAWNPPLAERKKELYALAHVSPRAAILEAWIDVESQIRRSAEYLNVDAGGDPVTVFSSVAAKSKRLTPSYPKHVRELRKLRNLAAHEPQLPVEKAEAMRYVTLALELAASIDSLTNPAHAHHFREE